MKGALHQKPCLLRPAPSFPGTQKAPEHAQLLYPPCICREERQLMSVRKQRRRRLRSLYPRWVPWQQSYNTREGSGYLRADLFPAPIPKDQRSKVSGRFEVRELGQSQFKKYGEERGQLMQTHLKGDGRVWSGEHLPRPHTEQSLSWREGRRFWKLTFGALHYPETCKAVL